MKPASDTRLGGDPDSIRAVATWFRGTLAPLVETAVQHVAHILHSRFEAWEDSAGRAFAQDLVNGQRRMELFAAAIRKRAALLDEIAHTLEVAEGEMREAERLADLVHLPRQDGMIWPPNPNEGVDGRPENNTPEALNAYYQTRSETFDQIEELVEGAYTRIRTRLIGNESYDWNQLTFLAGDLVKEEVGVLVRQRGGGAASDLPLILRGRLDAPPPILRPESLGLPRPYGLTTRVLTVGGGPILALAGVGYDLYSGDPPQKILITTGVGFGVGSGVWLIAVNLLGAPGWAAALASGVLGFLASERAGWAYDDSRSARDKLLDCTPDTNPGRRSLPG